MTILSLSSHNGIHININNVTFTLPFALKCLCCHRWGVPSRQWATASVNSRISRHVLLTRVLTSDSQMPSVWRKGENTVLNSRARCAVSQVRGKPPQKIYSNPFKVPLRRRRQAFSVREPAAGRPSGYRAHKDNKDNPAGLSPI